LEVHLLIDALLDLLRRQLDNVNLLRLPGFPVAQPGRATELLKGSLLTAPPLPRPVDDIAWPHIDLAREELLGPRLAEGEQVVLLNERFDRLQGKEGLLERLQPGLHNLPGLRDTDPLEFDLVLAQTIPGRIWEDVLSL